MRAQSSRTTLRIPISHRARSPQDGEVKQQELLRLRDTDNNWAQSTDSSKRQWLRTPCVPEPLERLLVPVIQELLACLAQQVNPVALLNLPLRHHIIQRKGN